MSNSTLKTHFSYHIRTNYSYGFLLLVEGYWFIVSHNGLAGIVLLYRDKTFCDNKSFTRLS